MTSLFRDYEAITAYATLGAVVVALAVPFIARLWRWFARPRLRLEFANEQPYRRRAQIVGTAIHAVFFRIRVTNVGLTVARGVTGRVSAVVRSSGKDHPWFDPVSLHWVGTPYGSQHSPRLDLLPQQSEFLDVLRIDFDMKNWRAEHEFLLICQDNTPRGIHVKLPIDEQTVRVSILCENARGVGIELKLSASKGMVMPSAQVALMHRPVDAFGLALYPWELTELEPYTEPVPGADDTWDAPII